MSYLHVLENVMFVLKYVYVEQYGILEDLLLKLTNIIPRRFHNSFHHYFYLLDNLSPNHDPSLTISTHHKLRVLFSIILNKTNQDSSHGVLIVLHLSALSIMRD